MADIATGNYNFQTLKTPQTQDYGSVYVAVGNALNQKYYQNRQAYINNIANPLSQIKASSRGQKVLDSERAKIIEGSEQFKQDDNWFAADDYIFNTTENILTNEGIKAIQNDYALEQQYLEELKKSDWDTQAQNAFLLRSRINSSDIEYDSDTNTVIKGGFNPISIGKKFDINKYQKDVLDILSKAKADKISVESLVTDPDKIRQYGLDVATGYDGEKLASHFIKQGSSTERITEEQIQSYAMNLLNSNPEYRNYLTTVWQNNDALTRFVKDDSSAGGHLRDYELADYAPIFSGNPTMFALAGLDINLNELGAPTKEGKFSINKNISKELKDTISNIENQYGINIIDVLQNKVQIPQELIQQGLQGYLDKMFQSYTKGVLGATDDIESINKDSWTQNLLSNQYINNNIQSLASTASGLYSYQNVSQTIDMIANPAYKEFVKAQATNKQKELETLQQYTPYLDTLSGFEVTSDSVKENLSKTNEINDSMKKLENSMNQLFTTEELGLIGLQSGDGNLVKSLNYSTASQLVDNSNLSDESKLNLKGKLLEVQTAQRNYNNLKAQKQSNEIQLNSVFDIWKSNRNKIEGGLGWYRVNDNNAKFILDNRITNYSDYQKNLKEKGYKYQYNSDTQTGMYYKTGTREVLEELEPSEFDKVLINAADNVSNRYKNSIAGTPLEFTAVRSIIANPSKYQQDYLSQAKTIWKQGGGDISVVQTPTGKGIGMTGIDLARFIDFDAMPTSITTNSKGISVTRQNNPTKNSHPIPKDVLGTDYDVYSTSISPVVNGISAKSGIQEYAVTLYDESGAARGNIIIAEKSNPQTISRHILDNYRNVKPYATIGGELIARSAGHIESQYANAAMDFTTTGNTNSPSVNDISQLQTVVDNIGVVQYDLKIHEPFNYSIDGNSRRIEIGKSTNGYYVKDIQGLQYPDGTVKYGEFAYQGIQGSQVVIEGITDRNIKYYNTVNEALAPISEYILTQNGKILDMYEAAESQRTQQINNNYNRY